MKLEEPISMAKTRFRGAQLNNACTSKDIQDLINFGANIARFQIAPYPTTDLQDWKRQVSEHTDKLAAFAREFSGKIKLIADLHQAPPVEDGEEALDLLVEAWQEIVNKLGTLKAIFGFGLLNEPKPIKDLSVQEIMVALAREVRSLNKKKYILVTCKGSIPGQFTNLRPIALKRIIYELHMYLPMRLTHQGVLSAYPVGVKYPGKKLHIKKLRRMLSAVKDFQDSTGHKIIVGEFSISNHADDISQSEYVKDCISIFEENGWDWIYHAFREHPVWNPNERVHNILTKAWSKNTILQRILTFLF